MRNENASSGEKKASRPVYYGGQSPAVNATSSRSSALYYGGRSPAAYATSPRSPAIYYGGAAPAAAYPGGPGYGYGAGGYYYGGAGSGIGDEEDSLTGAITIGRMIRVCSQ